LPLDKIFNMIKQIQNEGVTILMVEQNAAKALNAASSAYVLELGAIKACGSTKKLLMDDGIKKTYLGL
jgi:branched-chain amino acid transport system ATP-binding protein